MIETIEKLKASPLEHLDQRVITLGMMDEAHGRPAGTAGRAFRKHRGKLKEGRHYFTVRAGELATRNVGNPGNPDTLQPLLTERGYLILVKTFRDDLAWEVQEELVEGYFRAREAPPSGGDPRITQALELAMQANRGMVEANQTARALMHLTSDVLRLVGRRQAEAGRVLAGFRPRERRLKPAADAPVLPFIDPQQPA